MLSSSSEVLYKSKLKRKVSGWRVLARTSWTSRTGSGGIAGVGIAIVVGYMLTEGSSQRERQHRYSMSNKPVKQFGQHQ
jgi:hypothetical protein